jgi:hypothetical protein
MNRIDSSRSSSRPVSGSAPLAEGVPRVLGEAKSPRAVEPAEGVPRVLGEAKPESSAKERLGDCFVLDKATPAPAAEDPRSDLEAIREKRAQAKKPRTTKSAPVKEVQKKELTQAQLLDVARKAIVESFEKDFVPSENFQDTFEKATWAEVAAQVKADAKAFGNDPDFEVSPRGDGGLTFVGRIYGLYTEVDLRMDGTLVNKPYFEID